MEEAKGGEEQQSEGREIRLNEEFDLFPPNATSVYELAHGLKLINSEIILAIEDGEQAFPLPLTAAARPRTTYQYPILAFTPFAAEGSYLVDQRDFDPQQRARKIEPYTYRSQHHISSSNFFVVDTGRIDAMRKLGIIEGDSMDFTPQVRAVISRLRLVVNTPLVRETEGEEEENEFQADGIALEAYPYLSNGSATVEFSQFHPLDFGPMASVEGVKLPRLNIGVVVGAASNLAILLPTELDKLASIRGKFMLSPEQPQIEEEE